MTLTPNHRALILESLTAGCDLATAARGASVPLPSVRAAMAEDSEEGRAWAGEVARALEEGRAGAGVEWADIARASAATPDPAKPAPPVQPSKRAAEHTDDGSPDWHSFIERAAEQYGEGRTGLYLAQDDRLIAGGYPETSPWWRWTFTSYFESGLTWLLAMVGRGAGKSTFLERLLLIIILFTDRTIPPGQTYQSPFISVLPEDARRRIYEIQRILLVAYYLELKVNQGGITIKDLNGNDIELISVAGTVGRVSGPSTVSAIFDEAAKLHTAPGAANLDSELIASIVGTSRLLPGWAGVRCSSAWETRGAHFLGVTEGTNGQNFVATIGRDFIADALAGLEEVARWESAQGNTHEAAQIRAFAKTLGPESPNVPTWVARPAQSALRLRMMLDTLPKDDPTLEGLTRHQYWLREYASMPLSREGGDDYAAECRVAADMMDRLRGRSRRLSPEEMTPERAVAARVRAPMPTLDWKKRRTL